MADVIFPGQTGGTIGAELLPSNQNIVFWKGDYFPLTITLNSGGNPVNLTGHTPAAQIRTEDGVTSYNFSVSMNAAAGTVELVLTSAVSSTIPAGTYIWDFQITDQSGNVRTYIAGDVTVYDEVTRA